MKATEAKFLAFLKKSPQFVIPIYQRTYSWTERECWQLWEDILRTGRNDKISAHFVGSIVYIEQGRKKKSSSIGVWNSTWKSSGWRLSSRKSSRISEMD